MVFPELIDETRVHRALGDRSRVRILEALRGADTPLDATELASRVRLHANTVRSHLRILEEAGLVSSRPEERSRPGRPRLRYAATPEGVSREERAGYRLLAEILASHLSSSGAEADTQAEQAGQAWGRYVARTSQLASPTAEDGVEAVVSLLEQFGFSPTLQADDRGVTVLMQRCPFGEVADHYRTIVCSVHLGLMQGALQGLGANIEAGELEPFVRPGICAAHLEHVDAPGRAQDV